MSNNKLILEDLSIDVIEKNTTMKNYLSLQDNGYKNPGILFNLDNKKYDYSIINNTKYRILKDTSTDEFTKLVVNNVNNIFDVVLFLQSFLHHEIFMNINNELTINIKTASDVEKNMYPLLDDESINVYFKGGTLMKYYKDQLIKNPRNKLLREHLEKNFKISDIDMNLRIDTDLFLRFNQIKYCVSKILANKLRFLSYNLDNLYKNNKKKLYQISKNTFIINNKYIKIYNQTFKINKPNKNSNNIVKNYIKIHKKRIINLVNQLNIGKLQKYANNINEFNFLNNTNLLTHSAIYNSYKLEFLLFIINILKKKKIQLDIRKITNLITIIEEANKCIINIEYKKIKTIFDNYDLFTKNLKTAFTKLKNELGNQKIYNYDSEPPTIFKINNNWDEDNLLVDVSRGDFVILPNKYVNSGMQLVEFNGKELENKHYVSYNNNINIFMNNKCVAFSLFRIKHLIKIQNYLINTYNNTVVPSINIPAEFLDISISLPYDGYKYMPRAKNQFKLKEINNYNSNKIILCDNPNNILQDLSYILFLQNTCHLPWSDIKYEKRIFRMFFFLKYLKSIPIKKQTYTQSYIILNELLDCFLNYTTQYILDKKKYLNIRKKILLNQCIENIDFQKNLHKTYSFEFISNNIYQINYLYYPIKDFLTTVLLTNDLILINTNDNKNNLFTNILKHSFKIYNIINSGVENVDFIDNYKKEYFKFIEICKKNIKMINSI